MFFATFDVGTREPVGPIDSHQTDIWKQDVHVVIETVADTIRLPMVETVADMIRLPMIEDPAATRTAC